MAIKIKPTKRQLLKVNLETNMEVFSNAGTTPAIAGVLLNALKARTAESVGQMSSNPGLMSYPVPKVTITRKVNYNPTTLVDTQGLPANTSVLLANVKGFTVVDECHLKISGATSDEVNMIEDLLKEGVIL